MRVLPTSITRRGPPKDWLAGLLATNDHDREAAHMAILLWLIWKARNSAHHDNERQSTTTLWTRGQSLRNEYDEERTH